VKAPLLQSGRNNADRVPSTPDEHANFCVSLYLNDRICHANNLTLDPSNLIKNLTATSCEIRQRRNGVIQINQRNNEGVADMKNNYIRMVCRQQAGLRTGIGLVENGVN
jgi:hypothetical protein